MSRSYLNKWIALISISVLFLVACDNTSYENSEESETTVQVKDDNLFLGFKEGMTKAEVDSQVSIELLNRSLVEEAWSNNRGKGLWFQIDANNAMDVQFDFDNDKELRSVKLIGKDFGEGLNLKDYFKAANDFGVSNAIRRYSELCYKLTNLLTEKYGEPVKDYEEDYYVYDPNPSRKKNKNEIMNLPRKYKICKYMYKNKIANKYIEVVEDFQPTITYYSYAEIARRQKNEAESREYERKAEQDLLEKL